jgi:S-adenosylmethionine decarboxylase
MENAFGPHLVIDLKNCSKEKLSDYNLHFEFLSTLPKKIGMTPITQPYVFPYSGLVPEDKGITGIAIIAESHISIHSFEEKGYCFIDIFSCKPFDYEGVIPMVCEFFGCEEFEVTTIQRGIDFPR